MININPSEIRGPLSRYQGTKIEEDDFFQLIENINKQCDVPVSVEVLKNTFSGLWSQMSSELSSIIAKTKNSAATKNRKDSINTEAIEEILLLLRKQNSILSSPDQLLPRDYFEYINETVLNRGNKEDYLALCVELLQYLAWLINRCENDNSLINVYEAIVSDIIPIFERHFHRRDSPRIYMMIRELKNICRARKGLFGEGVPDK